MTNTNAALLTKVKDTEIRSMYHPVVIIVPNLLLDMGGGVLMQRSEWDGSMRTRREVGQTKQVG
jgi:hypothetical protein